MALPVPKTSKNLQDLPNEIILQVLSYLSPYHITILQLVSRKFRVICLDDKVWRQRCFDESPFVEAIARRRELSLVHAQGLEGLAEGGNEAEWGADVQYTQDGKPAGRLRSGDLAEETIKQRRLDMENWDPVFPSERVSWYDEYIQRSAPIVTSWFQEPKFQHDNVEDSVDVRGVALYTPGCHGSNSMTELLAVSPLDNGSVCLWDVNGSRIQRGAILATSKENILFMDGPNSDNTRRSKRIDTGVTECIAVDSWSNRAYIAVQSHLWEIDLQRLETVSQESYPWSITALSAARAGTALTVGTSLGVHLQDFRIRRRLAADLSERVDHYSGIEAGALDYVSRDIQRVFDEDPLPPYAPLSQPTPLSILHLPQPGNMDLLTHDIYVAGRFTSILHYDRRKFPSIVDSIYSGASLSALAALPYPFSTVDSELRRKGELSLAQVRHAKSTPGGRTLIACGEYNTKGSLELYGLVLNDNCSRSDVVELRSAQKNRQTSARSKILSVINHGSRIAFSDSSGNIKWFERDGFTEVRRHKIGNSEVQNQPSIFASMPGSDDLARKILSTGAVASGGSGSGSGCAAGGTGAAGQGGEALNSNGDAGRFNADDILFWTGEKLGILTFSNRPGFSAEDFEPVQSRTSEEARAADDEKTYSARMRRALEVHANEMQFMSNLGLDGGPP